MNHSDICYKLIISCAPQKKLYFILLNYSFCIFEVFGHLFTAFLLHGYQSFTLFEDDIVTGGFWGTNTMSGRYGQPLGKPV